MHHTLPPLCSAHAKMFEGAATDPGEPEEAAPVEQVVAPAAPVEQVAAPETIDDVFNDLAERQAQLSTYINTCIHDGADLQGLVNVFALHGQNASRLGRLLRDRRALSGEASDGIAGALAQALDELSTELGTEL